MDNAFRCRKVFVVGCPRSGTTWLSNMLGQHPDIVKASYESWIYKLVYEPFEYIHTFTVKQRLHNIKFLFQRYGLVPLLRGIRTDDLWRGILQDYANGQSRGIGLYRLISYEQLEELLQQAKGQHGSDLEKAEYLVSEVLEVAFVNLNGKPHQIFLEKTPEHIRRTQRILDAFPEATIIEIVRDGRDVCASFQSLAKSKNQKWAKRSTPEIIDLWKRYIGYGNKFRDVSSKTDRFYSVRYEDLKQNTSGELSKMFQLLKLEVNQSTLKSIVEKNDIRKVKVKGEGHKTNQGIVGRWRDKLSQSEISLWSQNADDTLTRLGYVKD